MGALFLLLAIRAICENAQMDRAFEEMMRDDRQSAPQADDTRTDAVNRT